MADTKKTDKKNETITREPSKYYVVRTTRETRDRLKKKIEELNERMVESNLKQGREFIKEFKNDPFDRLDDLLGDTQELVKDLAEDSRKKVDTLVSDSKSYLKKTADHPFKTVGDTVKSVREDAESALKKVREAREKAAKGIDQDVQLILEDISEMGKKSIDRLPMRKSVDKAVKSSMDKLPGMLNLPSRKMIGELLEGIEGVNKRIDSLEKERATA